MQASLVPQRKLTSKMSDDISDCINAFQTLRLESSNVDKYILFETQEPNVLTCRMPQTTTGDGDNCDDTGTDSDSDIIVVVDSCLEVSSEASFIHPSDLSSSTSVSSSQAKIWDCELSAYTIPETESETENDINGSTRGSRIMDDLVSTPIKRKHESFSSSRELQRSNVAPLKVLPSPVVTTRSGRMVRARIDLKFDYSSELNDDDLKDSDDSNEAGFGGVKNDDDDDTDYEDDEDYNQQKHTEPIRKQRRMSVRSSCCSSSDGSSILEPDALIYVDLKQPVAIVSCEPTADDAVEYDSDLKTRLQKFLGLVAPQRRLYNPMANYELESKHMDENVCLSLSGSRLWATNTNAQSIVAGTPTKHALPSPMVARFTSPASAITNEMKILLIDDIVQRTNASYFESQTPQHIKEPIDLSGLPSMQQRVHNCQLHKRILSLLGPCSGSASYSFVDSLKPDTPLNMCHPLALTYRKRDFEACKTMLAKNLFNMLNHKIFHCGLRPSISWKRSMNTPSTIIHRIEAGGQRGSHIVLWQNIKQSSVLVKALLHEMCHAAAFVYHGETGHGNNCRKWAYRAKSLLPELPQINDCTASYKYTCLLCRDRSIGMIKFEYEEQRLRCHYCQFEVNVEPWVENVHSLSLIDQLVTPFKQFVRANYSKCEQSSHSAKMRALNAQYKENRHQATSNLS